LARSNHEKGKRVKLAKRGPWDRKKASDHFKRKTLSKRKRAPFRSAGLGLEEENRD